MATLAEKGKIFCPECNTLKKSGEFYRSNNTEKYPTGRLPMCKKCRTLMVDNWNSSTFVDILEECDVPWIPQEWNILLEGYAQESPEKCTPSSIIGRYLSKMQLKQYCQYRWADTDAIQAEKAEEMSEIMAAQGYNEEEIEQAIKRNRQLLTPPKYESIKDKLDPMKLAAMRPIVPKHIEPIQEDTAEEEIVVNNDGTIQNPEQIRDYFSEIYDDDVSYENDLTDEDKKYLRLKWGKTYNTDELIRLEKLYREMEESFDIQNAGHRDTLVKACKTSLKADQLLDLGDVESAQKMIRMYETLMKIGKFTAVQNKAEQGECLDTVSELTLMCEKNGFIPRFYTERPQDKVDETILDLKEYTKDLFNGESNLESMIEMAVKQMYEQEHKEEDEDIDEDEISLQDIEVMVKDKDFSDFSEFLDEEQQMTEESIKKLVEGDNDDR